MRETETKDIDGDTYEYFQLPPKQAIRTATKLFQIIGGSLTKIVGALGGTEGKNVPLLEKNINFDIVGDAIMSLGDRMDDEKVIDIFSTLLDVTYFKGAKVGWEHPNFQGKPFHLLKVVKGAIEVNFADFFAVVSGSLGTPRRADTTPEPRMSMDGYGDPSSPKSPRLKKSSGIGA